MLGSESYCADTRLRLLASEVNIADSPQVDLASHIL